MSKYKVSCNDCIHIKVCSIYDFARKFNEESSVKFSPITMSEVCDNFIQSIGE